MNVITHPKQTHLNELHEKAGARASQVTLPTPRDEYWRYTDPQGFIGADIFPPTDGVENTGFGAGQSLRVVFNGGAFDAAQSDWQALQELDGIEIVPLENISADHWAFAEYAMLEAHGQTPVARPLAALNSARAQAGVAIRVRAGGHPPPIELIYHCPAGQKETYIHNILWVEGGSICLLENGIGGARFNTVLEVRIAPKAVCHHLRIQPQTGAQTIASHIFAELGREAEMRSFTLNEGTKLTRNEIFLTLKGGDNTAHVGGIFVGQNAAHHDDTVFITHDGVAGNSRQVFKKALRQGATGAFQGKILVKEGARKTDGYQLSKALVLDETSHFQAKPELEIYNDDVICSHGSTTGTIEKTALFYLRARGISLKDAKNMLVFSFLAEALGEIYDPNLREMLAKRLAKQLGIPYESAE